MAHKHTKHCYLCRKTKSTDDFYKHRNRYDGLRAVCKRCDHLTRRIRTYRLTLPEFMEMWKIQGRRCDICNTRFRSREDAVIDHHHISGKVRALLCNRCNSFILPLVEHEGALIDRARKYVRSHGNKSLRPKRYNSAHYGKSNAQHVSVARDTARLRERPARRKARPG